MTIYKSFLCLSFGFNRTRHIKMENGTPSKRTLEKMSVLQLMSVLYNLKFGKGLKQNIIKLILE